MKKAANLIKKKENGKGLASAWTRIRGDKLWYRLKDMSIEIGCAWQRAWRGYDVREVSNLGPHFAEQMPVLLREFKKLRNKQLRRPDTLEYISENETEQLLNDLIFYFENCKETYVYYRLYGLSMWEDNFNKERMRVVKEECSRCRVEALRLFQIWCFALWC